MGCWYETCAITNLPILEGERVYVMYLEEGFNPYSSFHSHGVYYRLLPFFFEGEYDEYGGIDNPRGVMLDRIILPGIKAKLCEIEAGENQYHDIPVETDKFDVELLLNADFEDLLYVENNYMTHDKQPGQRLTKIIVKPDVIDGIIANYKCDINCDEETVFKYIINKINTWKHDIELLDNQSFNMPISIKNSLFHSAIRVDSGDSQDVYDISKIVLDNQDIWEDIRYQLAVYAMLNMFYDDCRRVFIKPSGMGSQNRDTHAQEILAKLTLAELPKYEYDE